MTGTLPRGIQVVKWKNKDKSRSVRYRIRISRKNLHIDRLFDDLDEAKEFLSKSKTKSGRIQLIEDEAKRQADNAELAALFTKPTLGFLIDEYKKDYAPELEESAPETKRRTRKARRARLDSIKTALAPATPEFWRDAKLAEVAFPIVVKHPSKPLGEITLDEIGENFGTDYIVERLKTHKASTVAREVGELQTFFNKLRYIIPASAAERVGNPFAEADKSRLEGHNVKRKRRLTEDEENRLFAVLRECQNPEMIQITALALATGMRRGEILALQWEYIEDGTITLPDTITKNSQERVVPINDAAQEIINSIERRDERLFHYTADGFSANWKRVKKRADIEDFRFHDCRREFISRMVGLVSSSIAIAGMTGMSDAAYVERTYVEPVARKQRAKQGIQSEKDLMHAVGHNSLGMTNRYTTLVQGVKSRKSKKTATGS